VLRRLRRLGIRCISGHCTIVGKQGVCISRVRRGLKLTRGGGLVLNEGERVSVDVMDAWEGGRLEAVWMGECSFLFSILHILCSYFIFFIVHV
jgi:hypothetical protein